ncbi:MAG: cbb3-type cytochrome c oxidase subunit I [Thermoanaerobaculia bacterium]|nr:cbb3-type cytochrome c oxidase subunit I [Thermoanaerobaculia bacterium]
MSATKNPHRLEISHFAVAVTAFALASVLAVLQALVRADVAVPMKSESLYYISVTAHGVLMALVFTTFFIMGLGYCFARATVGLEWTRVAWVSFWIALAGTLMTTASILSGKSTVLYTFYPPLQAHWTFYVGATLLVVGSWGFCAVMIRSYLAWRRSHRAEPVPLAMHGMLATVAIWLLATAGLAVEMLTMLIPWSLGMIERVDPAIARTWFWWFGHPLTYFWLVPAYVVWYTVLPKHAGGRLFSDKLTRVVFMMFILFSTPVGFHHQFSDPGISSSWKLLHTLTTYAILFPSFVTAFTVTASLEVAGRMKGKKGLFDWIGALPWRDPLFSSVVLAMLTFGIGGFGGAINAAYAMNTMVHNTAWIQGHFHLTVGTAVALTFMGVTYWLLPRVLGRELRFAPLAAVQPYLWFFGMMLFSIPSHIVGLMGMPRRIYTAELFGSPVARTWQPFSTASAVGGVILFVSAMLYIVVVAATALWGRRVNGQTIEFSEPLEGAPEYGLWDRFAIWATLAVVLIVLAYAVPISHLYMMERFPSLPQMPF